MVGHRSIPRQTVPHTKAPQYPASKQACKQAHNPHASATLPQHSTLLVSQVAVRVVSLCAVAAKLAAGSRAGCGGREGAPRLRCEAVQEGLQLLRGGDSGRGARHACGEG